MSKTSCSSVLLRCLGITLHTVSYKRTQKLRNLLTSVMAAIYESLPGKYLALLKLLMSLCRYRPSLTVYLAVEL